MRTSKKKCVKLIQNIHCVFDYKENEDKNTNQHTGNSMGDVHISGQTRIMQLHRRNK